jgi:hypothetical protein
VVHSCELVKRDDCARSQQPIQGSLDVQCGGVQVCIAVDNEPILWAELADKLGQCFLKEPLGKSYALICNVGRFAFSGEMSGFPCARGAVPRLGQTLERIETKEPGTRMRVQREPVPH